MRSNESREEQLLHQAAQGDAGAAEALLASQRSKLKTMIQARLDRRIAGRVDPSDVVQEVMITALSRLPQYFEEQPLPLYPWLRQIAREQLVDLYRRHVTSQKRSVLR